MEEFEMKRFFKVFVGVIKSFFAEDFIKDASKCDRVLLYIGTFPYIIFSLLKYGIKKIGKIMRCAGRCVAKQVRFNPKVAISTVAIIILFIMIVCFNAVSNTRENEWAKKTENTKYITVVAGNDEHQFYTWWEIASVHCPDGMFVDNYRKNDSRNYLYRLYEANGGQHTLREGERVKVPVYPDI